MERLNKSGRILMEYRTEYKKHYSDSVDENLKEAINVLYNDKKIDEKIFRNIFNESIMDDDFERMLLRKKEFTKNTSELNYEFDQVRKKVNEYMIEIGFTNSMNTKNSIDTNKLIIIHQFDLNRSYIMASFGLNQTEIIPLMKRRGFIEKFAVLRLNQVLKEIYGEMKMPEDIDHGYSLVYYNKKTQSFSIDYKFYVNIDIVSDENRMKTLINKIRDLDQIISKKFHSKLGSNYFNEPKNNTNNLKINQKDKPIPKQPIIQSVQDIVNKKKEQEDKKPNEQEKVSKPQPKQKDQSKKPEYEQPKENKGNQQDNGPPMKQTKQEQYNKQNADKKTNEQTFDDVKIDFDVSDIDLL